MLEISLPDDNSELEPPDPISNSEVKRLSADGSVGFPHVRVGHRQALNKKAPCVSTGLFLFLTMTHSNEVRERMRLRLPSLSRVLAARISEASTDTRDAVGFDSASLVLGGVFLYRLFCHRANMGERETINDLLARLAARQAVAVDAWPADAAVGPADIGLRIDDYGDLFWPEQPQVLDAEALAQQLGGIEVSYFPVVDSTNSRLLAAGATTSIADRLYLAEFQYGGRGRRGRNWLSPFARNLAMSLGRASTRSLSELGGLSLVVGLALADAFENLAVQGVQVKWPNDVLVSGHKLSGILVELVQRKRRVEYVIGIGVNVHITEAESRRIEQPVTDLRRLGVALSRTDLVVVLMQRLKEYLELFERDGFGPFVTAFNDLHLYHRQTCLLVHGNTTTVGVVEGIGQQGELLLRTEAGVQRYHGGEVSLRADPG